MAEKCYYTYRFPFLEIITNELQEQWEEAGLVSSNFYSAARDLESAKVSLQHRLLGENRIPKSRRGSVVLDAELIFPNTLYEIKKAGNTFELRAVETEG